MEERYLFALAVSRLPAETRLRLEGRVLPASPGRVASQAGVDRAAGCVIPFLYEYR
jgi:hypothetical protein